MNAASPTDTLVCRLLDALRRELHEYGEMLARLEQQQEYVMVRAADDVLHSVVAINEQADRIQAARHQREQCQTELAAVVGAAATPPTTSAAEASSPTPGTSPASPTSEGELGTRGTRPSEVISRRDELCESPSSGASPSSPTSEGELGTRGTRPSEVISRRDELCESPSSGASPSSPAPEGELGTRGTRPSEVISRRDELCESPSSGVSPSSPAPRGELGTVAQPSWLHHPGSQGGCTTTSPASAALPDFAALLPRLPETYRGAVAALVQENNDLLVRVQQRARQNHLLLSRSLALMQQFVQSLAPAAGPATYTDLGVLQANSAPPPPMYEAVG